MGDTMSIRHELEQDKEKIIQQVKEGKNSTYLGKIYNCNGGYINEILREWGISRKASDKHKDKHSKILELHAQGLSTNKIAEELKIGISTVVRFIKKQGLQYNFGRRVHNGGPLRNQSAEIIELYQQGKSCYEIGHLLDCADNSVAEILRENNVDVKSLPVYIHNKDFFEKIDNHAKAWLLGIWFTDGCNMVSEERIALVMTDKDVIEKAQKLLEYTGNITIKTRQKEHYLDQYVLRLHSKKLSSDLEKLGCGQRKTYHVKFPTIEQLPLEFYSSFFLGINDGDGCITNHVGEDWHIRIAGTKSLCESIKEILNQQLNLGGAIYLSSTNPKTGHETWVYNVGGNHQTKKLLDWIYSTSTPETRMNRKYEKYQEFLKYYAEKHPNPV